MRDLYSLVYTSSRSAHCTDEEISKILDSCRRNNPYYGVTGVLLHTEKRFLQYLEGEKNKLEELYKKISLDNRHGGVNIREFSSSENRLFPTWHMGYKDLDSRQLDFNSVISEKDKALFKSVIEDRDLEDENGTRVLKVFFELA